MKKVTIGLIGSLFGAAGTLTAMEIIKKNKKKTADKTGEDKFRLYYNILNQWFLLKQEGKKISDYFKENEIERIAVYGMGELGCRLIEELKNSGIEVVCGIDSKPENVFSEIEVVSVGKPIDNVDAIVVSAVFAFESIENTLNDYMTCPIISLEEIIYSLT